MSYRRIILHAGSLRRQLLHTFRHRFSGSIRAAVLVTIVACRSTSPLTGSSVAAGPVSAPLEPAGLPSVPRLTGAPLAPRVQYPAENQVIVSRDSNFVLGSIGSGDAKLSINGIDVPVAPNGAFLAWLPNPAGGTPNAPPRYELMATRGADTARRTVTVRYPRRVVLPLNGPLLVDSASVSPAPRLRTLADEWVRVSVRAASNSKVELWLADGTRRPMVSNTVIRDAVAPTTPAGIPIVRSEAMPSPDAFSDVFATDVRAALLTASAASTRIVVSRGADTTRLPVPAVEVMSPTVRMLGALRSANRVGSDTDRVVHARTIPDGTYKWMLHPGTVLEITGRTATSTRVRLDQALDVWVANEEIVALPEGSALPRRVSGGIRVSPYAEWVDVAITLGDRPAFLVEPDGRTIVLTLYGVQINPEISPMLGNDTLIRRISWDQVGSDRARITLTLSQPAYGWLSLWDETRRAFVLRVRRAPRVNAANPLAGLTIAVDAGHPPAGATGPTGLYEGDAVLPVAKLVEQLLRTKGATPVMTRETLAPLGLTERGVAARRANAHAFVSIHLNALPDGVNPFLANGTSTLFFNQTSEPLARPMQRALMARFGLRDLGVHYQNLAVARPTWYPGVLTEGLFLMIPEQEAAMRNDAFLKKYADAIVEGLEMYFRELGRP